MDLVDSADRRHHLVPPARKNFEMVLPRELLLESSLSSKWKRVRVFVSSTFRDMHGERDLINRFVAPEIRRRARKLRLEVQVVDLRWGVTSDLDDEDFVSPLIGSKNGDGISEVLTCLREAERCQLFVGFLGERYGWKPQISLAQLEVENQRRGSKKARELLGMLKLRMEKERLSELSEMSITEMEMELAALGRKEEVMERAFFFLRDPSRLCAQLDRRKASDFACQDEDVGRLTRLKQRVRSSGLEVFDGYPASYGGVVHGKPVASGLEDLGQRVVEVLWNALTKIAKEEVTSDAMSSMKEQEAFCHNLIKHNFVPRPKVTESVLRSVKAACDAGSGLVEITGKPGSGATSVLCKLTKDLLAQAKRRSLVCIPFFTEVFLRGVCKDLCEEGDAD